MAKLRKKWIVGFVLECIALGLVASGVAIWVKCSAMPEDIQVERKLTAADSIFFDSVKKVKPTFIKIIDSTLHIKVDLYRVLNYKGDTTIWDSDECEIGKSSFKCYHKECLGCQHARLTMIGDRIAKNHYKDTIYDTTYQNLNFGKNALVKYIPITKIPKLNKKKIKKRLSKLSGEACSEIANLKSNYTFEAIGLPEGFVWKVDSNESNEEPYEAYIKHDDSVEKCFVAKVSHRPRFYTPPSITSTCTCSYTYLPEQEEAFYSKLFNGSLESYKDTTITWKLVYKDQYGRGDTLDITTKFE